MKRIVLAIGALIVATLAIAQTVNPPVIPPGSALLTTNNTWTGTNTWSNTATFSGTTALNGTTTFANVPSFPSQTANKFLAAPSGSSGIPSFRTLANSDLTSATGTGVPTALATATNASGGTALVNGTPTSGNCTKWSASGVADAGTPCAPSFRNRLINGDFYFQVRGVVGATFSASISCVGSCNYGPDRWLGNATGAAFTFGQTSAPSSGYLYGLTMTGIASNTSAYVAQRIESAMIYDQASSPVSLSVNIYCSGAQTFQWALYTPTVTDNFSSETLVTSGTWSVTTTPTAYSASATLSAAATKGLEVRFYPQNGGAFTSGTCTLSGAQLEPGAVATTFERLPVQLAYTTTTRYCISSQDYGSAPGSGGHVGLVLLGSYGTANGGYGLTFPNPLRATPSFLFIYDGAGTQNKVSAYISGAWTDGIAISQLSLGTKSAVLASSSAITGTIFLSYLVCAEL